ncbi:LysE family translocator [uncultured Eudoraea sp.]|uniref:LysE family translocator n=1 Tax=uncultured Eudoraea sp. TaxID=1035614 RepID=UPI0026330082|nr:LysE family translocator [uncultured Eudoraea sp.]
MNYEILSAFILATSALAISPGPDNIFVLTQSIANGTKYGLSTTAGLISGCIVHTTLLAFGVSALIKENDQIFFIIKLFGALYLFFLAYKVYRTKAHIAIDNAETPKKSLGQLFRQGFTMNVLNPKVTIFFLAFFPGFLFSEDLNTVIQFYVLGLLFMIVTFFIFSTIALLSGAIAIQIKKHSGIEVFLKWLQIVVFIGIAIFLLFSDN